MAIRAFDRAQEAYNLAKKHAVQTKVIVFVSSRPIPGSSSVEIRFNYPGKIVDIYASCGTAGASKTVMTLEKCSKDDYISTPVWEAVATGIQIDANEKTNLTSTSSITLLDSNVNKDDHFRISFSEVGAGLANLTVEIVVEI